MSSTSFGFFGDPPLADRLVEAGLPVIGRGTYAASARAINEAYKKRAMMPHVVVVDSPDINPQFLAFFTTLATRKHMIVVDHPEGIFGALDKATHITRDRDIDVADLLIGAGASPSACEPASGITIPALADSTDLDDLIPDDETPEPAPAVVEPAQAYVPPAVVAPAPAVVEPAQVAPRLGDILTNASPAQQMSTHRAPVLFVVAGKGGVFKTTSAMTLAQRAAASGLSVLLIDGNRGQGDIPGFLRLTAGYPSIYDLATGKKFGTCVMSPTTIASYRPRMSEVKFHLLAAPPKGMTDPSITTSDVYRQAIITSRSNPRIDLVIIDTQIAEDSDQTKLFDEVFVPMMKKDAFVLALTEASLPSAQNLHSRIEAWGVDRSRCLLAFTKITEKEESALGSLSQWAEPWSRVMGVIRYSNEAMGLQRGGHLLDETDTFREVTGNVLTAITGRPFDSAPATPRARGLARFLRR